jgi:hypothetical protein
MTRVSVDVRYKGAWDEAQRRVVARDRALLHYLLLSSSLLGVALTNASLQLLALVVPYLALVVALMLCHHDWVLGVLTRYLEEIAEEEANPGGAIPEGPNPEDWFASKDWVGSALGAGWLHSTAQVLALAGASVIAILLTREPSGAQALFTAMWFLSLAATAAAVLLTVVFRVYRQSQRRRLS